MSQLPEGAIFLQGPDVRQGHPVERVVLAGGVDGHVTKEQLVTLREGGIKAVIADDIACQAGGAAQPGSR